MIGEDKEILPEVQLEKVISGGQTGIDRMGLEVAASLGIQTGGTAPKEYKTEIGNDPTLKDFGLVEHTSSAYNPRTIQNIIDSDATVLFGNVNSPGSRLTIAECKRLGKECFINPITPQFLYLMIRMYKVKTLNVAGNRASKITFEQVEKYREILRITLKKCQLK